MEYWSMNLLNSKEQYMRELPRVTGGKLEWSIFKSVPGSGTLNVTRTLPDDVDWLNDRIEIKHYKDEVMTPQGIWLISHPGWKWSNDIARTTIKLFDKCELLNSEIGNWYTIPSGRVVTTEIEKIIKARAPGSRIEMVRSPLKLGSALTWDPSDTWLDVVQRLTTSITYASLWADNVGAFRVEPYVEPGSRPVNDVYGPGPADLKLKGEWEDELALSDVPTGVVAYTRGDEKKLGMTASANLPASHPLGAVRRGRTIIKTYSSDAPNMATLRKNASRLLDDAIAVTRKATVTHPIDHTNMNDAVNHRPLGLTGMIVQRSVDIGKGAVVNDIIRRIYRGGNVPWA